MYSVYFKQLAKSWLSLLNWSRIRRLACRPETDPKPFIPCPGLADPGPDGMPHDAIDRSNTGAGVTVPSASTKYLQVIIVMVDCKLYSVAADSILWFD